MTITDTKLTRQKLKFSRQISKSLLPLESGNLQLGKTKFSVFSLCFGKMFKFHVFYLTGNFFWPFSLFSLFFLCSGYPELGAKRLTLRNIEGRRGTEGLMTDSYAKLPAGLESGLRLWA